MFQSLFTPLRSSFSAPSISRPPPTEVGDGEEDPESPEAFARDVLVQLMRNAIDELKMAEDAQARAEILSEIQRIMKQECRTKDAFRESDGYLVLISILSTINTTHSAVEDMPTLDETVHTVFRILSDSMHEHTDNQEYFVTRVGYDTLAQAMNGLVADPALSDTMARLILSLAMHDFSSTRLYSPTRGKSYDITEATITTYNQYRTIIRRPGAIKLLWDLLPLLTTGDPPMRYGYYKLIDIFAQTNHRNLAILSSVGIVQALLLLLYPPNPINHLPTRERAVVQKLLRRLLELGVTTEEARLLFQRCVRADETLDEEWLGIAKGAMSARWPEHFSFDGRGALVLKNKSSKGMLGTGFTFMIWLRFESFPSTSTTLFSFHTSSSHSVLTLSVRPEGRLGLESAGNPNAVGDPTTSISKMRWNHLVLIYHPSNHTIRLYLDGALCDTLRWVYPNSNLGARAFTYVIGDGTQEDDARWSVSSAYLLSTSLRAFPLLSWKSGLALTPHIVAIPPLSADSLPRFIHALGPRYTGTFQDPCLIKFLTYEASTALNMFLNSAEQPQVELVRAVRDGAGIPEAAIVFSLSTASTLSREPTKSESGAWEIHGDVFVVHAQCLDMALWKVGGAAVGLRLVQLANTPHELSRTLKILSDGIRGNWRNSVDIERLKGYDVLANILHTKAQLFNMTSFETIFEFLGLNFRNPDQSTIINAIAYRTLALDFSLWSRTPLQIQRVHLTHFTTLLQTSRHRKFNLKQRLSKMGLVRKLLFVLQMDWYGNEAEEWLVDALKCVMGVWFKGEETIKPVVSYLAANLHEVPSGEASHSSSSSTLSRISFARTRARARAELVLTALTSLLLTTPLLYNKFAALLPFHRIALLLLGTHPTPTITHEILSLIGLTLSVSPVFAKKWEAVGGWSVIRSVLPGAWDDRVRVVAMAVLMGKAIAGQGTGVVRCPQIFQAILAALGGELRLMTTFTEAGEIAATPGDPSSLPYTTVETLIEDFTRLHKSVPSFRRLFKSPQTTQMFLDAYRSFVDALTQACPNPAVTTILEKMTHFGLVLAMKGEVAPVPKSEIMQLAQTAQTILDPSSEGNFTIITPTILSDGRPILTPPRTSSLRTNTHSAESALQKSFQRTLEWRNSIVVTERKRLRKTLLDLRENQRQMSRLQGWSLVLSSERGLWADPSIQRSWMLDETEGPHRIRIKLEARNDRLLTFRGSDHEPERQSECDADSQSMVQVDVPPWPDFQELASMEADDARQLIEDIPEDKHRRVRHELEAGDVIEAVHTVARVVGVDSSPGLLIFGRTHLYMLDGLVENEKGEVIDAHDAPRRLFFVPGSIVELDGPQTAQRWTYDLVASFSDRTFLFRDVALEIYFRDSRSLLIVLLDNKRCREVHQRLSSRVTKEQAHESRTPGMLRTPLAGPVAFMNFRADELSTAQRKWQAREMSNYTYLEILNQISGRTPSDATQYPIFPWVLRDYTSSELDLKSLDSFRDLTKPMGALTQARREAAQMRYSSLESVGEKPFHYGTHFSSSMIVCHFLIRLAPFTNMFKTLQGGDWDLPDRLFVDVGRAYDSASQDLRGDVRELISEFYTCPEFLENSANLDFGVQEHSGEKIHNVVLPPWAKNDPLMFITLNRQALESDFVSQNLPAWVDLIWGCKQRDPESLNVFHPLSYEGSIDLDAITDELEREATVGIIHNFGQTPRKLFSTVHPPRYMTGPTTLPLGSAYGVAENPDLLLQASRPLKDLGVPVRELVVDLIGDKILPCPEGALCSPSRPHEQVHWNGGDLRVLVDNKVVHVTEAASCTCAIWADPQNLVTGSNDHIVRVWQYSQTSQPSSFLSRGAGSLHLRHIMRVHTDAVICVAASRAWSMAVSGSKDGSAAVWDLNRGLYVRSIWHEQEGGETGVHIVAINDSTGYIATCSKTQLRLHTINAKPIATLDLGSSLSPHLPPPIISLAFHEREYSHMGVLATGGSDGTITLRTWNANQTPAGETARWEFVTLRYMKVREYANSTGDGPEGRPVCVTSVKFIGEKLCHGEDTGKAFIWAIPD